ncbi:hypothetical protein GCM10007978_24120 [Shewanella hanedai]|nr:hypothetical protein GCM10007978_24120 [Shewanella hanedai]
MAPTKEPIRLETVKQYALFVYEITNLKGLLTGLVRPKIGNYWPRLLEPLMISTAAEKPDSKPS